MKPKTKHNTTHPNMEQALKLAFTILILPLVEAIKELSARVDSLEARA